MIVVVLVVVVVDVDVELELVLDDVDVDVEHDVDVVVGQGSGLHEPTPRSRPASVAQSVADSTTHVNAPPTELGTQHWVRLWTVVLVVDVVVVLEVTGGDDDDVVVVECRDVVDVVTCKDVVDVVVPGEPVVVVVVDASAHGVAPFGPSSDVTQSTKAPTVESTIARSPRVRQSSRLSSCANPNGSLPEHLEVQRTSKAPPAFAALALHSSRQSPSRPQSRNFPDVHLLAGPVTPRSVRSVAS